MGTSSSRWLPLIWTAVCALEAHAGGFVARTPPVRSPISPVAVARRAELNEALTGLHGGNAGELNQLARAGQALLQRGPLLVVPWDEGGRVYLLSRNEKRPAAALRFGGKLRTLPTADALGELGAALGRSHGSAAARDLRASHLLIGQFYEGAPAPGGDEITWLEKVDSKRGTLISAREPNRNELRALDPISGAIRRIEVPRWFHYEELFTQPLSNENVLAKLSSRTGRTSRLAQIDPRTGDSWIYRYDARDVNVVHALQHPDGRQLVQVKQIGGLLRPSAVRLAFINFRTGARRDVRLSRELHSTYIERIFFGGRRALLTEQRPHPHRPKAWLVELDTGRLSPL